MLANMCTHTFAVLWLLVILDSLKNKNKYKKIGINCNIEISSISARNVQ